jgi:hypothetical protein
MAAPQKNTSLLKRKSYSIFLKVTVKKGVADDENIQGIFCISPRGITLVESTQI